MLKSWNPRNWDAKKLCESLLVGFAALEFLIYLALIIMQHETSKIMIIGSVNVITSFLGLIFVMFTLIKNLKRIHRTSYMILGVVSFLMRAVCLFLITYFYRNPTQDFFITNETDNALLYSNFIWMACYTALFYIRPKKDIYTDSSGKMLKQFN